MGNCDCDDCVSMMMMMVPSCCGDVTEGGVQGSQSAPPSHLLSKRRLPDYWISAFPSLTPAAIVNALPRFAGQRKAGDQHSNECYDVNALAGCCAYAECAANDLADDETMMDHEGDNGPDSATPQEKRKRTRRGRRGGRNRRKVNGSAQHGPNNKACVAPAPGSALVGDSSFASNESRNDVFGTYDEQSVAQLVNALYPFKDGTESPCRSGAGDMNSASPPYIMTSTLHTPEAAVGVSLRNSLLPLLPSEVAAARAAHLQPPGCPAIATNVWSQSSKSRFKFPLARV